MYKDLYRTCRAIVLLIKPFSRTFFLPLHSWFAIRIACCTTFCDRYLSSNCPARNGRWSSAFEQGGWHVGRVQVPLKAKITFREVISAFIKQHMVNYAFVTFLNYRINLKQKPKLKKKMMLKKLSLTSLTPRNSVCF